MSSVISTSAPAKRRRTQSRSARARCFVSHTQLRVTLDYLKAKKDQVALFANRPSTAILTAAPPMTIPAA
jgi:hypothetical protein